MTTGLSIAALLVSVAAAVGTAAQVLYSRRQLAEERELRERQLDALSTEAAVRPSVRASKVAFSDDGAEVTVTVYVTNIGGASEAYWEAALIEPEDGRQVGSRVRGPAPLVPNMEHPVVFHFQRAELPPTTEYLAVAFMWGGGHVLRPRRSKHRIQYGRAWRDWQKVHPGKRHEESRARVPGEGSHDVRAVDSDRELRRPADEHAARWEYHAKE